MKDLRRMAEEGAKQVPLAEQLASVPETARLVIDDADGKGTHYIPVGRMCKEASAALAKLTQEQEPVGEVVKGQDGWPWVRFSEYQTSEVARLRIGTKLYTRPIPSQQEERKPLTYDQIVRICPAELQGASADGVGRLVRAVEARHNIRGQQ